MRCTLPTLQEAQHRLGFEFQALKVTPIGDMLSTREGGLGKLIEDSIGHDARQSVKQRIYSNIVDHLGFEGYPLDSTVDFCESNINDLVYTTLGPILACLRSTTGRDLRLRRQKQIVSVDGKTGGKAEFVVMDVVSLTEVNYVLVVEGKMEVLGQAMKQCLLSMRDMWDQNGTGEVYGFTTTGERWQMFKYNGKYFERTRQMEFIYWGVEQDQREWMTGGSQVVDCLFGTLLKGGMVKQEVAG